MRTSLSTVLALLVVNDAVLVVLLDAPVPAWGLALGGALVLTAPVAAVAGLTSEDNSPASNADLEAEVRELRERVDELAETGDGAVDGDDGTGNADAGGEN
ncbi:MAG: hypothetical protein ABEJ88_02360 [Halobacterium sp.]